MTRQRLRLGPAITGPAHRIHDGGGVLARRYGRWLWPEDEDRQSIIGAGRRLAGSAALAYLGTTVVTDSPALMWPATVGGLYAAWRAGGAADSEPAAGDDHLPSDSTETGDTEPDRQDEQQPAEQPPEPPVSPITEAEFTELVRSLIGTGRGIHLAEIVDELNEHLPTHRWDLPTVRALADGAGIPCVPTRSSTRRGSTTGIRAADLPAPPPAPTTSLGTVVDAGGSANNNINNVRAEQYGEATIILRLPADTARHHTVRRAS